MRFTSGLGIITILTLFSLSTVGAKTAPDFTLPDSDHQLYTLSTRAVTPLIIIYTGNSTDIAPYEAILTDYTDYHLDVWVVSPESVSVESTSALYPLLQDDGTFADLFAMDEQGYLLINAENEIVSQSLELPGERLLRDKLNQMLGISHKKNKTWGKIKSLYLD
ncbi:MAG: hypothetical protein D6675_15065 [Gemmatimonadetes bacterium]|nr:MAG: hypothetical protein D6675_15065 [Gemmatimonadota bacterium]